MVVFTEDCCGSSKKLYTQACFHHETEFFLRLQYTLRSIIFFKSEVLVQNIGRGVIFNVLKKLLKKTKFWQRNRGFTFTPEVKVYPLIDSSVMLCNQPR